MFWKMGWNILHWSRLQPHTTQRAHSQVCVSQCPQGLLFSGDDARSPACPTDPNSLSSRDVEQVLSPGLCLSHTESLSQILSKEPQWSVTTGLPKPAKKRQGLGCPAQFMVKCHLVIQRTQHSDTESQNYTGLFPLPDFQILTPMSHITENTKVLMSPVPEISALKRKPWYSLTDTEPKCPSPIRRQAH